MSLGTFDVMISRCEYTIKELTNYMNFHFFSFDHSFYICVRCIQQKEAVFVFNNMNYTTSIIHSSRFLKNTIYKTILLHNSMRHTISIKYTVIWESSDNIKSCSNHVNININEHIIFNTQCNKLNSQSISLSLT